MVIRTQLCFYTVILLVYPNIKILKSSEFAYSFIRWIKAGDSLKKTGRFFSFVKMTFGVLMVTLAVVCIAVRFPQCFSDADTAMLTAAAFTLSDGKLGDFQTETAPENNENEEKEIDYTVPTVAADSSAPEPETSDADRDNYYNTYADHSGEEKYTVTEKHYTDYGTAYENFFVQNKTDYSPDIGELLNSPLDFKMENNGQPEVLIMHTHTCESYLDADEGFFYESFYPRSTDNNFNVTRVGEAIAKSLKEQGIGVIHDTTIHDYPSYNGSYERSRATIDSYLEKYPSIKVVLDIHRDALGSETNKMKPTFTYNGKKAAQIMIMCGCDDGTMDFPQWNDNLKFALKLQKETETMYPGMTRPLNFGYFTYNMNVNSGSLLIEFGTDGNTLDEAVYSGKLFGVSLAKVLQS